MNYTKNCDGRGDMNFTRHIPAPQRTNLLDYDVNAGRRHRGEVKKIAKKRGNGGDEEGR